MTWCILSGNNTFDMGKKKAAIANTKTIQCGIRYVCVCVGKGKENEGEKWEVRRKIMRVKLVGQMAPFHDKFFSATMKIFSKQFTFL